MPGSNLQAAASCVICLLLAFFFAAVGSAKLVAPGAAQQTFTRWGHPDWFHLLIGTLEVGGAALLLYRRTTTLAAAVLAGVMLGAVATHLRNENYLAALLPIALLAPIACVGFCRRLDALWMRRVTLGPHPFPGVPASGPRHADLPDAADLRVIADQRGSELRRVDGSPFHQRRA